MEKKKATQSELKWCRTGKWRAANGWRAIFLTPMDVCQMK